MYKNFSSKISRLNNRRAINFLDSLERYRSEPILVPRFLELISIRQDNSVPKTFRRSVSPSTSRARDS